jgi:outer membrane receptor for ferrienterochelin and colicins
MTKKTILLMLGILCAFYANAQNTDAMLFGDVKCKDTGKHLPYATIMVKGTKLKTTCDASGHFKLVDLPLGRQTVVASMMGYKSQEIDVTMQEDKGTEAYFSLEEDELAINQVVVTGTRTQHYVKNVPIRTEVLTSQAMINKNAQNVFEALENTPGIRVEQQCQFCNFSEVRMQGLGAEHTQVLVDGEPIYSGLAGVYGLQQMNTNDLDRIEIVKGAGSALYGSSAVAGAINLISKEPGYEPSVKGDLQFGNFGYKNYNASGSWRNNNIGFNIFAQRTEMDAVDATRDGVGRKEVKHKDGISDRVDDKVNNLGFGVYFYSPFSKGDKLIIRGKATDEERRGGVMTDDQYLNPFSETTENIKTNRLTSELTYSLPWGESTSLDFAAAYVHHRREATNDTYLISYRDTHDGESPAVESMRPYLAKENTFTPSLTLSTKLGSHSLLLGAQGYFTRLRETGLYCITGDPGDEYYGVDYTSIGKKHASEFGLFAQDEWDITPQLCVVPGLRLDTHNSGEEYTSSKKVFDGNFPKTKFNETSISPRLAVKYAPSASLVLRANVGTGFRAPYGFSEDLHLCSGSPRVWKSSELKAEKSASFNISADYYGKNFQLSANIFRTDLKNKIAFGDADEKVRALGYTYQWENKGDAYVQGIELGAKLSLMKDLTANLNWTFNQGKYKNVRDEWKYDDILESMETAVRDAMSGGNADDLKAAQDHLASVKGREAEYRQYEKDSKKISRFPEMTGDFTLEYTPGTWTVTLTGSLQGKMFIDYLAEAGMQESKIKQTDTFMLFNCRVAKQLGRFTVYAGGKNLFSYVQDEKHTDDAAFMYAPVYGATWYAGVSVRL